jgi:cation transport ATPase
MKLKCSDCGSTNINRKSTYWICHDCGKEWELSVKEIEHLLKKDKKLAASFEGNLLRGHIEKINAESKFVTPKNMEMDPELYKFLKEMQDKRKRNAEIKQYYSVDHLSDEQIDEFAAKKLAELKKEERKLEESYESISNSYISNKLSLIWENLYGPSGAMDKMNEHERYKKNTKKELESKLEGIRKEIKVLGGKTELERREEQSIRWEQQKREFQEEERKRHEEEERERKHKEKVRKRNRILLRIVLGFVAGIGLGLVGALISNIEAIVQGILFIVFFVIIISYTIRHIRDGIGACIFGGIIFGLIVCTPILAIILLCNYFVYESSISIAIVVGVTAIVTAIVVPLIYLILWFLFSEER